MRLFVSLFITFLFATSFGVCREISQYKEMASTIPQNEAYIDTLFEQYSENQIRDLVRRLNLSDIRYAKQNGLPTPVILSEKSLQNKEELRKYLRNHFGYSM